MKVGKKKYYKRKLDAYWSQKIRSRGKCDRCGSTKKKLEMAHIQSRNNQYLRWDEQNLLCLCTACHFWSHQDPLGFNIFIRTMFPKRYEYLVKNKNKLVKRSAKDLKEMCIDLGIITK